MGYWVVAPEVKHVWVVALNGHQAGGTRDSVTADEDGSLPGFGGVGQVAGERWCSLVGGGSLRAGLSNQ